MSYNTIISICTIISYIYVDICYLKQIKKRKKEIEELNNSINELREKIEFFKNNND